MSWSHIESEPMPDSPLSDSPYEVLGVPADADAAALRAAYRRALRLTHPDTGGDPARLFIGGHSAGDGLEPHDQLEQVGQGHRQADAPAQ